MLLVQGESGFSHINIPCHQTLSWGPSLFFTTAQHPSLLLNTDVFHVPGKMAAPQPKRQDPFSSRVKTPWKNIDCPVLHHMPNTVTHALGEGKKHCSKTTTMYVHGIKNFKKYENINM